MFAENDVRTRFLGDLGLKMPAEIEKLFGKQFYAQISAERLDLLDTADVLVLVASRKPQTRQLTVIAQLQAPARGARGPARDDRRPGSRDRDVVLVGAVDPLSAARGRPAPACRARVSRRAGGLALIVAGLALVLLLSISVGARPIPVDRVWGLVWSPDGSDDAIIVHDLRIPRTILGLIVGAALGVGGALMQALTRNPLADPGLLGVNAGAAAAVVTATAVLGVVSPLVYVWFAFLGAGVASVVVYGVGAAGHSGATPVRLALAGTAVSFALIAYVQGLTLIDRETLDQYRFWQVGALAGHPPSLSWQIAPFIAIGLLLAFALGRPLNAIGLGDEAGRALGASPGARASSARWRSRCCAGRRRPRPGRSRSSA